MREAGFAPDRESKFGGGRTDQTEMHVTCVAVLILSTSRIQFQVRSQDKTINLEVFLPTRHPIFSRLTSSLVSLIKSFFFFLA